jgi:uncharacterized protein (DUF1501 family)
LVVIQLAGGNDGINTVVPMSGPLNATYRQRRPTLAVAQQQILRLGTDAKGNEIGLHPNMTKIKSLFDQGKAGVIQGVGYESANRSHFRSMDIWHTANPDRFETTGWLGDYLDVTYPSNDNPLISVYIGGTLPLGLQAKTIPVPAINNPDDYKFQKVDWYGPGEANNRVQTFLALNQESAPEQVLRETVRATGIAAYDSSVSFQTEISKYPQDPAVVYNDMNPLAKGLFTVARMISSGVLGTKILYVTLNGFDTHQSQNVNQNPALTHPRLMQWLDEAVDVFYRDMVRLGKSDKVLILTWSEFGRKVGENGDKGTDHGASAPQFVFGDAVRSGIYGEHPSLTNLDYDDGTIYSIDFRRMYATVLESWLGTDSRDLLGGTFEPVPFL